MAWLIFGLAILAQSHPDLGCFMFDPPWAKRGPIFIRRECPAAFEKLAETEETAQGMFLSTCEEAGKVVGWPGGFLGSHFWRNPSPRSRVFLWLTLPGPKRPKCSEAVSALQPATGSQGLPNCSDNVFRS